MCFKIRTLSFFPAPAAMPSHTIVDSYPQYTVSSANCLGHDVLMQQQKSNNYNPSVTCDFLTTIHRPVTSPQYDDDREVALSHFLKSTFWFPLLDFVCLPHSSHLSTPCEQT